MKTSRAIVPFAIAAALSLAACSKHDAANNSAAALDNGTTEISADEGNGLDANTLGETAPIDNSDAGIAGNDSEIANAQ